MKHHVNCVLVKVPCYLCGNNLKTNIRLNVHDKHHEHVDFICNDLDKS